MSSLRKVVFSTLRKQLCCRDFSTELSNDVKSPSHCPVMASEAVCYLQPSAGQLFIDMTFGAGGHTKHLLQYCPTLKIIALDRDPVAHDFAKELSSQFPGQVTPLLGRFSELPKLLCDLQIKQNSVDGILFDFGCSSMQFDIADRGFSLSKEGPLDMRMDGNRFPNNPTASDVLSTAEEEDLIKIFKVYGEEKLAKKIARAIVEARYTFKSFRTTREFADFVSDICDKNYRLDKIHRSTHIATKVFQALRIFVNNELNEINYGMIIAEKYLKIGGRLVTITFHSLEDIIVKRHILGQAIGNSVMKVPQKYYDYSKCHDLDELSHDLSSKWCMVHKHVITPTEDEVTANPRSRSAKLRAAVKV